MQKFLRTLMLAAVMLLPFVSNAQTCTPISTFPVTYGFEDSEGFTTFVTSATACTTNVFNSCWRNEETSFNGTSTTSGRIWHIYGGTTTSQIHSGAHSLTLPDKGSSSAVSTTMLTFPAMSFTNPGGYVVSFWIYRNGTGTNPEGFKMYVSTTDTIDANAVELGHYSRNRSIEFPTVEETSGWYQYETDTITMTGTVYLIFEGQSYYGSSTYIDDIAIEEVLPCSKVTNLEVTAVTANSITLSWTDALNTGATYRVIDATGSVTSGITGTTYTVTGLNANTEYTFSVTADCGADGLSVAKTVTGRTACGTVSLPYTMGFEAEDLVATTPNADALPFCWSRYASGTGSNTYFPYSYNSSTYAHEGSRLLYFYDGTGATYPDTMVAIMPAVDVVNYPMNANRLTFWGRVASGTNVKKVQIGTMTDPTDMSTFILVDTVAVSGTTHTLYSVPLTNATATAPYVAIMLVKSTSGYLCIDDVTLEEMPSCLEVSDVTASNITASSITLTWVDASNSGATYTIYDMADTSLVGFAMDTTFIVTNLDANTQYTFGVQANCTLGDAAVMTVSARTECNAIASLPFEDSFENVPTGSYMMPYCWNRYASEYTSSSVYPYSYNGSSSAHSGSRSLYFYGTTGSTYSDTMIAILPQLDVTAYPMNGNRVLFWAKMGSASNSKNVYVGTMTNPADPSTFAVVDSSLVSGNTYTLHTVLMTNANATAPYVALMVMKGTGTMYIDDLTLEETPSCLEVPSVEVTGATTTTVSLSWTANSGNASATYSVYDMADTSLLASGITGTTYTVQNLQSGTMYVFGVQANCTAGDAAFTTVSTATACEAITLPYTETFEATSGTRTCWNLVSMNTGNDIGTSNGMGYFTVNNREVLRFSSYSNHGGSGDYNQYGYSPLLNVSSDAANLQVDVTFATYNASNKLWFGYITATDTVWDPTEYTTTGQSDFQTESFIIPATATQLCVHYYGNYSYYAWIDSVIVTELGSGFCYPVTGLTASNITATSATLSWNEAGYMNSYFVEGDSVWETGYVTSQNNTITFTNLQPSTTYTIGITNICDVNEESDMVTVTFTTACAPVNLPFDEDFEVSLSTDPCWFGASNITADSVFNGGVLTYTANNAWTYSDAVSNGLPAGHYRVNIYGTGCKKWMITPQIDLSTALSPLLSFDAAFTVWTSSSDAPATGFENNETQKFMVLVSANDGQTWTLASDISLASIASSTYIPQYVDLSNYAGDTVRIAFYAQSTVSGGDNNLHIDNIYIDELIGELCLPVTGLTTSDITATGATLNWNSTGAVSYTVIDMSDNSFVATVSDTTYELTGLTAMTSYSYGIVANCNTTTSDTVDITFATACTAINLPYTETFGANSATRNCWTLEASGNIGGANGMGFVTLDNREVLRFSSYSYASDYNQYGYSPIMNVSSDATNLQVAVTYATYGNNDKLWFGYITANDTVWDTTAYTTTGSDDFQTESFIIPATAIQLVTHYYGDYSYYAWIDEVSVTELSANYCYPVTGLVVDSATANSLFLSWNDNNNSGVTYTIYGDNGNVIATGITTTSYEVTNLMPLTSYTFGVATNCSATSFSDVVIVTGVTACGGESCTISIVAGDSYGDGWNGNTIEVMQNGSVVATYSMPNIGSDLDTAYVSVCSGMPVSFNWITGSYAYETSFEILNANGASVYTGLGSDMVDDSIFFTAADLCSGSTLGDSIIISAVVGIPVHGSVSPSGVSYYHVGETVTFTATPDNGYVFSHWVVSIIDTVAGGSTSAVADTVLVNPFDVVVDENLASHFMVILQANFESTSGIVDSMTVYVATASSSMGTTNPAPGTYRLGAGDSIAFEAVANPDYHFLYWIEETQYVNNGPIHTDTIETASVSYSAQTWLLESIVVLTAYFEADPVLPVESTITADEITYWVGTGSNEAIIAVNWVDAAYAWGVRFNGSITVQNAMDTIATYDNRFNYTLGDWGLSDITFDEGNLHLAGDPMSWWESKNNGVGGDMGLYQTLANGDLEKWAQPVAGVWTDSVWDEQWQYWMQVYTYTDEILPMWAPAPEEVTITFTVNDASMGTITPSGLITFEVGEAFTVTATPAANCHFVNWVVTTAEGETIVLQRDMLSFTDTIEANWDGSTITANFARNQGIEEVDGFDFQAYSVDGRIVVKGVENMPVSVYDVNGRNVKRIAKAAETVEFAVPSTGVYIVKVGNSAAKRVVVLH